MAGLPLAGVRAVTSQTPSSRGRGGRNQRVGRAGEYYVAAELNRRGAYAVTFTGNMPEVDVMARSADGKKTIYLQVKTKSSGTWQTTKSQGYRTPQKDIFWVFVDLKDDAPPRYWIVPEKYILDDIKQGVSKWRQKPRDNNKPESPLSGMKYSVAEERIAHFEGKWDLLDLNLGVGKP